MTKLELLALLYSLDELLDIEDMEAAIEKARRVIKKVIKEAESKPSSERPN